MPLTSLSSLLHSWELNTYVYVISNTLYKDQGVFLFLLFFSFLSCIIKANNPCQSYRCPEDSSCYHNDTHFTCVSHAQEDSNRKNGETFFRTVIFQFSWCWSAIMLWYGYCLLSLNPLYCDIYSRLTLRRWTKISKTPKVFHICSVGLSLAPSLHPPLKCIMDNNEVLIKIPSKNTANV